MEVMEIAALPISYTIPIRSAAIISRSFVSNQDEWYLLSGNFSSSSYLPTRSSERFFFPLFSISSPRIIVMFKRVGCCDARVWSLTGNVYWNERYFRAKDPAGKFFGLVPTIPVFASARRTNSSLCYFFRREYRKSEYYTSVVVRATLFNLNKFTSL